MAQFLHGAVPFDGLLDVSDLANFVSDLKAKLNDCGIRIERSFDPDAYVKAAAAAGRTPSPLFDPDRFAFPPGGMFWLRAVDDNGRVIHLQAVRVDDTETGSLADLVPALFRQGWQASPQVVTCPLLFEISGRVAYRGDFWKAEGTGIHGLAGDLARLGAAYTFTTWQRAPDYCWAIFERGSFDRGVAGRSWFQNTAPIGQAWHGWIAADEWVGTLGYREFIRQVALNRASLLQAP